LKKLWSCFTDDMDHCYFTGTFQIERHHVFGGSRKKASEKYGYVFPLAPNLHPNGVFADKSIAHEMDLKLKIMCEEQFLKNHGTKEDFIRIFGKSYI